MKKLFVPLLFVFCFHALFNFCAASTPVALKDYGDPQANNVWRHLRDLKEKK